MMSYRQNLADNNSNKPPAARQTKNAIRTDGLSTSQKLFFTGIAKLKQASLEDVVVPKFMLRFSALRVSDNRVNLIENVVSN